MVCRIELSILECQMCEIARSRRSRETRQGLDGWADVSFYIIVAPADVFRQGKFQLEVMQEVGHYLHEVSSYFQAVKAQYALMQ